MTSEKVCRKDKNQNIQVFVRLRPLNQRERDIKSLGVIEVVNNREVVVRQSQQTALTKKFTFDRAFGPHAKQVEIYQDVVSPLIEEVLAGYNCTVFAYGQTGTGKTHTMVGENSGDETTWQTDPLAGIIPRALSQLFDELRISNTEYTVRVSYLELYNEELFDLLSSSEDNSKLRIYEDVTRKGSNIVNGLEEITVYNKNEVYKIMAQGQERKRVASTLMNAQSSRSHTVFTIVVHMKENSPEGEELVKIGKLNLVDLAGSENISKAGSDNPAKRERARECVNINQSLLTLGRVITALVERHPHIPYRESKLTRILQESLGGRTKTSIIATISPGHKDLEETMSTLEYAHRAKNIQNKPEVNQKMTKKAILKEFAEEIDRLKRDLQAARDKNGVYLASDTFAEMTLKQEEQRKEIQELLLKKRAMEEERDRAESVFTDLNQKLQLTGGELDAARNQLNTTKAKLANTDNMLRTTKLQYEEQKYIVSAHVHTEERLGAQARQLVRVADTAAAHASALHDSIDRRRSIESTNLEVTAAYRRESSQQRARVADGVHQFADSLLQTLNGLHSALDNFTTNCTETHEHNKNKLEQLVEKITESMNEAKSLTNSANSDITASAAEHETKMAAGLRSHSDAVHAALGAFLGALAACVQRAADTAARKDVANFVQQWYAGAMARVASLQRAQAGLARRTGRAHAARRQLAAAQRLARRARAERRAAAATACIKEIEEEKNQIEKRLTEQLVDIETERRQTEERLSQWMDEERRLLEERLAKHVTSEKMALEERLSKKVREIEEEQKLLEDRISRHIESQQEHLEASKLDLEMADKDLEDYDCGNEESSKHFSEYNKEFEEEASAVGAELAALPGRVAQVAGGLAQELRRAMHAAQAEVQQEASALAASSTNAAERFAADAQTLIAAVTAHAQRATNGLATTVESYNSFTAQELTSLVSSTASLIPSAAAHLASQTRTLEAIQHQIVNVDANVREAIAQHEELENRYLANEYRMYTPTGATPARALYRYPRALAATSPHGRILERFRQQRRLSGEEDCVVVESDSEAPAGSESESSSEDLAFAAPSPPAPAPAPATNNNNNNSNQAIFKSTSETDIYLRRKQQDKEQLGKENPDRSMTYRKPSKLPAPASLKKPLVERN